MKPVKRVSFRAVLRYGLGAVGLAGMGFGATQLVTNPQISGWTGVVEWLAGAVVLHDGVLAPAVIVLGALLGSRWRRRLRWPFVVAGCLTVVALPVLLRPGPTTNPSVLPLDYPRGLAIAVGTVVALALCWTAGRWARDRFRAGRTTGAGRPAGGE
jgi:hypothetical protein